MSRLCMAALLALAACASRQEDTGAAPAPTIGQTGTRVTTAGGGSGQTMTLESTSGPSTSAVSLRAARDVIWREIPAVYEELGIPLTKVDAASFVVGNEGMKVTRRLKGVPLSRFLQCGGAAPGSANADTYEITLSVLSQLRPATEGETQVVTTVDAAARPVAFNATSTVACSSTGALERRLHDRLTERVKTGS
ncbi:MAG: hypothetical protein WKG32_22425 [Gemmatimonadaceae bacterium]